MKLSILIPAYNAGKWLRKMVTELKAQIRNYPETEIVIVDDGGTDDMRWVQECRHVRYYRQPNFGEPTARNTCLDAARGEYIQFLDADDQIYGSCLRVVYENIEAGYDWVSYDWECDGSTKGAVQNRKSLMINCAVWAYTFRREFIGGQRFDRKLLVGCDTEWLGRVLREDCRHRHDGRVFYNYRWSGNDNSLCHRKLRGEFG